MKTEKTPRVGLRRRLVCAAVTGVAITFPLTMAAPATALPAAAPAVVHTNHYPRCDDWNQRHWEYCDRDRGHRCDRDWYNRNHWHDRDWDRCDRGHRGGGGGFHHWYPWGWFGS